MAGAKRSSNGSWPKRAESATQTLTAPGTVTASQPNVGILSRDANRCAVHASGEHPEAFRPTSSSPSHRMKNASLPTPLLFGSTTVSVMALACAASTALPPATRAPMPAWVASGWDVATRLSALTGERCDTQGWLGSYIFADPLKSRAWE